MPNVLDGHYGNETDQAGSLYCPQDELVDVDDGEVVLEFTYRYLEARSLPPSDDEVHNVIAAIAQYKGPRLIGWATLESFLAGLHPVQRA